MEMLKVSFTTMAILGFLLTFVFPVLINAQAPEPAMVPAMAPTSDGNAIDQGIAYVLMLAALVITYLIH
ncbi:hypothetical protein MKW94_024590 [Papaver nudicaule]|uniref:Uncharacterized protein n=1 Tax=Papaver nudicaule TaxID=74823 RepID=A0AA41VHB7_PAPNU|nr:hypothetical protein [Papaver nudicaule]